MSEVKDNLSPEEDAQPLEPEKAKELLQKLEGWQLSLDGKKILRKLEFKNFREVVDFIISLAAFAEKNNLSYKEAKQTFDFVTVKLKDKFITKPFYSSILLTGALKGVMAVENKYEMPMGDLEYNQLAFSLALGAQRYIIDHFAKPRFRRSLRIKLRNLSYGLVVPYIELFNVFVSYGKHIGSYTKQRFSKGWTKRAGRFLGTRFAEIQRGLFSILLEEKETQDKKERQNLAEAKEVFKMIWKAFLFLFKVILALPLSIYYMLKLFFQLFVNIWKFNQPEAKKKRQFEKDLAKESMVAMYDEIYSKLVLETYYYT